MGSGKSEVGKIFAGLGAFLIDADVLARDTVAPGTPGFAAVKARWPRAIDQTGTIDREALAAIVFADEGERQALNAIVHPQVRAAAAALESEAAADQIVVHEIPLLFETGQNAFFDATVLVTAPREARLERVMARSGLAHDEVVRRMAAQIAPEEARKFANFSIENNGNFEDLRKEVGGVFLSLRNLPRRSE